MAISNKRSVNLVCFYSLSFKYFVYPIGRNYLCGFYIGCEYNASRTKSPICLNYPFGAVYLLQIYKIFVIIGQTEVEIFPITYIHTPRCSHNLGGNEQYGAGSQLLVGGCRFDICIKVVHIPKHVYPLGLSCTART